VERVPENKVRPVRKRTGKKNEEWTKMKQVKRKLAQLQVFAGRREKKS